METLEQELPGGRDVEAAEDVHRRRFAGSGRAHDGSDIAALDIEVDALQRLESSRTAAVGLGDPAKDDQGIAHSSAAASLPVLTSIPGFTPYPSTTVRRPSEAHVVHLTG